MKREPDDVSTRLNLIRDRIAAAAARSGRAPDGVTLIGVVKTVAADQVRAAIAAGLTDVGENRVQEAERAISGLGELGARWHLIGHLQGNKSGRAVAGFDRIHTLDSLALALALSRHAAERGRVLPVLVQVNVSGEASKYGVPPSALSLLLEQVRGCPGLRVDGLMSIGTPVARAEDARAEFVRLRLLRDAAECALGAPLPQLSMGMSDNFEVAVEEGSTFVRIGSALFGARDPLHG